jgi:hypothetical protein
MSDQTEESKRSEPVPPDLYAARITANRETLAQLMREFALDVGCRPHGKVNPDGTATLQAFVTQERIRELQAAGYKVEPGENVSALARERHADIGKGDRFEGGRVAPRGLGQKAGRDRKGGRA